MHFLCYLWKDFVRHTDQEAWGLYWVRAFIWALCALGLNPVIENYRAAPALSHSHPEMQAREELVAQAVVCLPCWILKMKGGEGGGKSPAVWNWEDWAWRSSPVWERKTAVRLGDWRWIIVLTLDFGPFAWLKGLWALCTRQECKCLLLALSLG